MHTYIWIPVEKKKAQKGDDDDDEDSDDEPGAHQEIQELKIVAGNQGIEG
jgi:hypothetical protein